MINYDRRYRERFMRNWIWRIKYNFEGGRGRGKVIYVEWILWLKREGYESVGYILEEWIVVLLEFWVCRR